MYYAEKKEDSFGYGQGNTSEEKCGIIKQPEPSCHLINALEEKLRDDNLMTKDIEEKLEEIRGANMEIRKWGQQWKRKAKVYFDIS